MMTLTKAERYLRIVTELTKARPESRQEGFFKDEIATIISQADYQGCTVLEKRKIQEVAELDSFKKLSWFVVNEISADKNKNLYKKYENDSRWDEGYDFREMVTYDMLTDSQNELRVIFDDNIEEYFNKYIDPITDITGKSYRSI